MNCTTNVMKDLMIRHVSVDQIENGVEIILKIEKKKKQKTNRQNQN